MKTKAAILNGPDQLPIIGELDLKLESNKVMVKVMASALNHRDVWIKKGMYGGIIYPIILGSDGVVEYKGGLFLINPGLNWGNDEAFHGSNFEILGLPSHGCFAEYVQIEEKYLHPKPDHLSLTEAAAIPLAGLTAFRALFAKAQLKKSDKVFISGIGGGVALFAMQFAIANGNEVYVSSSSTEKIEKAIALGAKGGFNYKDEDMDKQVLKSVGPMDVVIDSAGGKGFSKLVNISNKGGRISIYGGTVGKMELIPQKLFWNHVSIYGTTMGSDQDFKEMIKFINFHKIKPIVDEVFPIQEIGAALLKMENGQQFGKLVLSNSF